MKTTGIICEYNPFHLGHEKQIRILREQNPTGGIVCLMSGNYVQRGMPAIFDKVHRAKAAILSGADLVLELPVTAALSSAEGFAAEGVRILNGFCDALSFGAEDADTQLLMHIAKALLSPEFSVQLKTRLAEGLSFPASRQKALEQMGINAEILSKPNNILAVEYCKAILSQNANINPEPVFRDGNYHDTIADIANPSASSVRLLMEKGEPWQKFIPQNAAACFEKATIHTLQNAEKAIVYRLKTMTDAEFEALPYGSEGLWRKLMKNARKHLTLEQIITATKSKRYTRTRLDRMIMCAFLGLTADDLCRSAPYARVLALNDTGRNILLKARQTGHFPNLGEPIDHPYQAIENRCDDLYFLFAEGNKETDHYAKQRVYYQENI